MPAIVSSTAEGERAKDADSAVMESEIQQMTGARSPILEYATFNVIGVFVPPPMPSDTNIPLTTEDGAPLLTEDGHPIILDN